MILGMTLHPGEECTRKVEGTEHLIIAALDCRPGKYPDDSHLTSCLLIKHGGYEQVVCTLEKGVLSQQKLDLVLLKNEIITFMVEGTGTVYITGYTTNNSITFEEDGSEIGETTPTKEKDAAAPNPDRQTDEHTTPDEDSEATRAVTKDCTGSTNQSPNSSSGDDHEDAEKQSEDARSEVGEPATEQRSDGDPEDAERQSEDAARSGDGEPAKERRSDDETEGDPVHSGEDTAFETCDETILNSHDESEDTPLQAVKDAVIAMKKETFLESIGIGLVGSEGRRMSKSPAKTPDQETDKTVSRTNDVTSRGSTEDTDEDGLQTTRGKTLNRTEPEGLSDSSNCTQQLTKRSHKKQKKWFPKKGSHKKGYRKETSHKDESDNSCSFCGKTFSSLYSLTRHERIHTGERPFHCTHCDKSFSDSSTMRKHERTHYEIIYKKEYRTEKNRKVRRTTVLADAIALKKEKLEAEDSAEQDSLQKTDRGVVPCRGRPKKRKSLMEQIAKLSMQRNGPSEVPCSPPIMGSSKKRKLGRPRKKSSILRVSLEHMIAAAEEDEETKSVAKDTSDQETDRKFGEPKQEPSILDEDLKEWGETGGKGISEDAIAAEQDLKVGTHEEPSPIQQDSLKEGKEQVQKKCLFCSKTFSSGGALRAHRQTHGIRPYKCGECSSSFRSRDHLRRHQTTHTGARPFQCQFCDRAFSRRDHMKKHQRTHNPTSKDEDELWVP